MNYDTKFMVPDTYRSVQEQATKQQVRKMK